MSITKNNIQEILDEAVFAPSGENCQPWRFVVRGESINIFNIPERDQSLYNVQQKGSLVAHGALAENIRIAAGASGYDVRIECLPDRNDPTLITTITFIPATLHEEILHTAIKKRVTNRKPYEKKSLETADREQILHAADSVSGGQVVLVDDSQRMSQVVSAFRPGEEILFSNQTMHNFLFSHLVWSLAEERTKKMGMFIHTLELSPPQRVIFRMIKSWPVLRALNYLGLAKKIASETTAKVYSASAAFGAVLLRQNNSSDFFTAGRIFQRAWLTATRLGLSFQPVTGILFLYQRILSGDHTSLSDEHNQMVEIAYKELAKIFSGDGRTVALAFRVGKGGQPSATSSRLPPVVEFAVE